MNKKRVMLLGNHAFVIYNFRKELIQRLLKDGYEVYLSMPYDDEKVPLMESWGCKFIETNVDRRGTNFINDFKLINFYFNIIKKYSPDVVLTYTIKPNLYGGIACSLLKIPYISNITGLGSGFKNDNILKRILILLYKIGLKKSSQVFFQNSSDKNELMQYNVIKNKYEVLPGSGVNLSEYQIKNLPFDNQISFVFIGRIMKDKGIYEYLEAAKTVNRLGYPNVKFNVVGFIEPTEKELIEKLNIMNNNKIINYLGYQSNVKPYIENAHCLVQPSHGGEGLSNVLLEAGAMGRPLIASDIPGCRETIIEGLNGYLFKAKDKEGLVEKVLKMINLTEKELSLMGLESRKKIEKEFDRKVVVERYIKEIKKIEVE
ncbi:glycosyltransferase family 4 protein [Exiguobacterium indicum]|uniref:glycosyltransferase family 4 protein n=1 Tax=Exiguobacterium indicum TaxID=296995 RepID=UPI002B258D74|nr:glycosyltransferase family 4 protein [Exiguobacterium indicum]